VPTASVPAKPACHGVVTYVAKHSRDETLEGAFGLRCLNHACDAGVEAMSDLFGAR
jgi:hypothetical protein